MLSYDLMIGDCAEVMKRYVCPVELVVTSPPYDDVRDYGGHKWDFVKTAHAIFESLNPGGILCWVVQDTIKDGAESLTSSRQKLYFGEMGFKVRTLIYQKPNFSHPSASWYHNVFEYVFVCSKGKPRCWNPIMDRKNIYAGQIGSKGPTRGQEDMCRKQIHPAPMPRWLARDLIRSFSNEGDFVLDPMCGGFTVGLEALKLNRHAIGIDIHEPYIKDAQQEVLQLLDKLP